MTCKKSRYKSYRQLVGRKVRAQPLQLNLRKLTRVIYLQMCAAIPQQYIHRHMLSMSTRYLAIDATRDQVDVQSIETKLNETCFDFVVLLL